MVHSSGCLLRKVSHFVCSTPKFANLKLKDLAGVLYRENLPVIICVSKITFHGDVPQSALEWGLAWKVILIKAQLEDFANH